MISRIRCWEHTILKMQSNIKSKKTKYHEIIYNGRFKEIREYMCGAAHNILNDMNDAEDAIQTAFEKAERGISTFDNREMNYDTVKVWLSQIAANAAKNILRKRTEICYSDLHLLLPNENMETIGTKLKNIMLKKESDLDYLITKEELERAKEGITKLPPTLRNTMLLSMSGLKYCQIAKIENAPLNTIKTRLYNARKTLTKSLDY